MATWTFVRHGQSVANAEGWLAGCLDSPLTARGLAEADATRRAVADIPLDRAFASDLSRARLTAQRLLAGREVPLVLTPALRERSAGAWSRRRLEDLAKTGTVELLLRGWRTRPPGGETLLQVATRAATWLATVDGDVDTLVVAHGALMRALLGALDDVPRDVIGDWRPGNCEVVQRSLSVGAWASLRDRLRAEARG